ncbi:PA-phosphatase [Bacteroidota bacterium]
MTKTLANTISILMHPLLMPTFMFMILIRFLPDIFNPLSMKAMFYVLLLVFLTTFVIPALSLLGLWTSSVISNLKLENKSERRLPFIFIAVFYTITTFLFIDKLDVNRVLIVIMISVSVQIVLLAVITFFWKISIHASGTGGMTGFLLALIYLFPETPLIYPFVGLILVSGLVLSSRLYLNVHSQTEVYIGYVLGFVLSFTSLYYLT